MVVSGRLMFVLLVAVTIVISRGRAPSTGLYFTLSDTVYQPGDTILITDIGSNTTNDRSDPQSSLVCVTTNVNTNCCRGADNPNGGGRGEWYLPDMSRLIYNTANNFYRARYTHQVRLYRNSAAMSPTGIFICVVPNMANTMNHTATVRIATVLPQLNVTLTGSSGTPAVGQNYMLICTASGGGSMAYTYMWLKNGSVVPGQTSSTYSFSPLRMTDYGGYSCRVRVGSTTMTTSSVVTIAVVGTATQLYFTWRGNRYEPGDSILITDIGLHVTSGSDIGPGDSLVCNTTDVNTQCCTDVGGVGEWLFPDRSMVPRNSDTTSKIVRTGRSSQVRLNFKSPQMSPPTGEYTCVVPETGGSVNQTAGIRLVTELPQLNVTLTGSGGTPTEGQNYMLTCTASGGGSMAYTYMWLKNGSVVPGQTSSTYSFSSLRLTDSGGYNCRVSLGSTSKTGEAVTITVVAVTTIPPLTVRIVSSSGTLTCEASGGGSMSYAYMWLRNGSVVSGQTSSTYSFSSLLAVHSGRYSCKVSNGSMTVTSEGVDITVQRTATRLYFTWRGHRYEPGDSIFITDIRLHEGDRGPGDSLVCVTTVVNTQCCTDEGSVGEWFFPDGSIVPRNIDDPSQNTQIIRTGRANQVRLNFRSSQTSPTGEYTCVVPETSGLVIHTAGIQLVNVTLTRSIGTPTEGQNYVLTCTTSGGDSMAYTYMWMKDGSVVSGQTSSTYSFSPLRLTNSGQYSCQVSLGSTNTISEAITITVMPAVPNPPSNLRATMHTATSITITWTETTTTNIDRYEVTYSYTVRRCSAPAGPAMTNTVTSTSRSHTLMNLNEDSTYTITVRNINGAASNMSTITANTATAVPSAGPSSVTSNTVETTSITIEWSELDCTDRNGDITGYRVRYGTTPSQRQIANISDPGRRMFTVDREFITLNYDFEVAAVNVNGTGPYSTPPLTVDTAVPSGLGFYLNGMSYSNNSVVTITDIGEGDMSLYCITSRSKCCRSSDGGERGDWFLPGQDSAVKDNSTADFSRRREPRAVVLNRRNNAVAPIGLYRCEVPDAGNTIQSLYIGVYTNDRGRPSVSLVSYSHVSQTLNCTSSGGPATNVTWRKDNVIISLTSSTHQQSQRVADEVTSTYYNLLSITSSNIEDHSGSFSCIVRNNRGSSENYLLDINKIEISGNLSRYQLGSSHRITCSSDLTVQSIQWLNTSDNGKILTNNTGEQQLVLELNDITTAINNTMYTCEVTLTLLTTPVMETIHLVVGEEGSPRHPESVIVTSTTPTGATIQWMLTEPFNAIGPETFVVLYGTTQDRLTRTSTSMVNATATRQTYSIQLSSLDIGTQYYFQVQSRNRFGSVVSNVMNFITDDTMSGPVRDLQTDSPDNSTLVISWRPPTTSNGIIISYTVRIDNVRDGTTLRDTMDHSAAMTSLTENNLIPGVPYRVSVAAVNRAGQGSITTLTNFTKELVPSISPRNVSITRTSPTVMVVSWIPLTLSEARGFITSYKVFYSPQVSKRKRQEPNTLQKIVSGDVSQTTIEGLDPNTAYNVQMSASTKAGASFLSKVILAPVPVTGDGGGGGGAVIGVVVGLLIAVLLGVVIVIAIIIIFIRYRRGTEAKYSPTAQKNSVRHHNKNTAQAMPLKESNEMKELEANEQNYENTEFIARERLKPIPVDKFAQHVQRMHADRDRQFELEYNSIEKSPQADYEAAVIPKNKARNRFGNIFPYDFNRVILKRKPGEENSDYINASYIDGYRRKKVYIGSQGPTENSLEDFWRMIWEQRVPTIVMLTRIFEGRKKCEEYWPENVDTPFVPVPDSPLSIQYDSVLPFPEFIIRKMTVTNSDEPGTPPLTVTLYHYLGWPDHGVPVNAISMVNFVKRVRKNHPYSKEDLLLVHCSAGVGRTGTFITLDSMLERINVEKSINILEFVSNLRKQRVLMVQTVVQYVFIHNALDELLTCGETEISAANMRIVIGKLSRPSEGQKITGFSKQFETLRNVSNEGRTMDFSNASSDVNMPKNRYKDILPNNHMRVRLKPSAAHGSDYINASFIEGYRQKGAYIATQGPLPNTVNDFWRMIWEHEVKCIVMLNQTEEKRQEVCHRYWPLGRGSSEAFGKCLVTLTSQENNNDYIIRKMDICENQSRISVSQTGFTITQIQYLKWPEDSVPQTTAAVLEIANLIQKVQMGSGNKSIVVMCNNGIGRSGAFICVHSQMERMKAEAMVDIFQFIKAVRIQRAGLVTSKEQYEFCHHVLADFLDGFDTYANFKEIV